MSNINRRLCKKFFMFTLSLVVITTLFCISSPSKSKGLYGWTGQPMLESEEIKKLHDNFKKYTDDDDIYFFQQYSPERLIAQASKDNIGFSIKGLVNKCLRYIFEEFYDNAGMFAKIIILASLSAFLRNLQVSFLSEGVSKLAFYVFYVAIISIIIESFNSIFNLSRSVLDTITNFGYASVPVLITLIMSTGNITTGSTIQPAIMVLIQLAILTLRNVFIPLTFMLAILGVINNISDQFKLSKLSEFIKQFIVISLGVILTLFAALVSMYSSIGVSIDGVTSKTAKFALGTFVPIIGKYLSDAADSVIGCSILIKNMAGVFVMIGIAFICLVPILKIVSLLFLYKLTCIIVEPITDKCIVNCINDVATSIMLMLGIVASSIIMFFIFITGVVSIGGGGTMLR